MALSEFALILFDSLEAALPVRVRQDFLDVQQADERYRPRSFADQLTGVPMTTLTAGAKAAREVEALTEFLRQ